MSKFIHALIMVVGILLVAASASAEQQRNKANCLGTFSNMYYNEEGGDLLGEELRIVLGRNFGEGLYGMVGMFQVAAGVIYEPVLVDVHCDGHTVEFNLPNSDSYIGRFRGTITSKGIHGKLIYPNGEEGDEIDLPRRASYWDKPVSR